MVNVYGEMMGIWTYDKDRSGSIDTVKVVFF